MVGLFMGVITTITIIAIFIAWEMVKYSRDLKAKQDDDDKRVDK
jgi:hypothetical protein